MGIGQLLTMPMFFASNAIYPLTYLIDALRGLVIAGGENIYGYGLDFAVMLIVFSILLAIAVKLYPTLAV